MSAELKESALLVLENCGTLIGINTSVPSSNGKQQTRSPKGSQGIKIVRSKRERRNMVLENAIGILVQGEKSMVFVNVGS